MITLIMNELKPALLTLVLLTLLTGVLYPGLVYGLAQLIFPAQANGSMIASGEKVAGSELIGQQFSSPQYFWGRLSATAVTGGSASLAYNAGASGGSNLGPTNPDLLKAVTDRIKALRDADPENKEAVPVDLATASGSGLDPHISPAAATYQVSRVAKARKLSAEKVADLVAQYTEGRQLGILGEARVNVLRLNLALDAEAIAVPAR